MLLLHRSECVCHLRVRAILVMSTHARIYSASACAGSSPCTGLPCMVRDSCLHAWSRTPSIPSILAAGVVYRARTVKPSHMSPPRGQSLPAARTVKPCTGVAATLYRRPTCSAHSEAVSYSCNAALAVGIPFLVGCNPKLVCPATLMLFSVGTVPASGGTPTL